jgi:hypothetical protein
MLKICRACPNLGSNGNHPSLRGLAEELAGVCPLVLLIIVLVWARWQR